MTYYAGVSREMWRGRDDIQARRKYARFCVKHDVRLPEDSLDCPGPPAHTSVSCIGDHEEGDNGDHFEVREVTE